MFLIHCAYFLSIGNDIYSLFIILCIHILLVRTKSMRKKKVPTKFNTYWDMHIPTEFYDEEFIEFENYLQTTGQINESSTEKPHSQSEYSLKEYAKFRKYVMMENRRLFRKLKMQKKKEKAQVKDKAKAMKVRTCPDRLFS